MLQRRTAGALLGIALAVGSTTFLAAAPVQAQTVTPDNSSSPPVISTTAGNGHTGFGGDGGRATAAKLTLPTGVAEDAAGNLYIADSLNFRIRKVTPAGLISTYAGTGQPGFSGDGGPATKAKLWTPESPAVDGAGNLYFADNGTNRIRRVSTVGIISTVAGTGECGRSGDGGPAVRARLCAPSAVALDGLGNLYIADTNNNEIRKVTPAGIISDFAGMGTAGATGDAGVATSARLSQPTGVAVDNLRNVYVADTGNNKIRKVDTGGRISTFAGTGAAGFSGDGGKATQARLNKPSGVGIDPLGNVYIADTFNFRIRVVIPKGDIFTFGGNGTPGYSGDGGPATMARINVVRGDLAADANNVYFTDTLNERLRRIQGGPPPNIPESPLVVALPLSVVAIVAGAFLITRRRQRSEDAST